MLESISQLGLPFFGLTTKTAPQARIQLFTQIHEIVFHGKGGYDWLTIYNMPTWLRNFTFKKILDHYNKESEIAKAQSTPEGTTNILDSSGKITPPQFNKKTSYK